jgi:hypothetical protein
MPRVLVQGVNMNEVSAWDGASNPLPPAEYLFEVDSCVVGNSKNNNPQLEFDLIVVTGAESDLYNGTSRKHWVPMTTKAAGRVRCILDACGVQMDAEGGFDSDHFTGARFIAEVFEDTYSKPNLETGGETEKTVNKIRKERHESAGFSNQDGIAQTVVAPGTPAAGMPVAPTVPTTPVAPTASVAPTAPARPLPPAQAPARIATTLPAGTRARAPIPRRA